MNTTAVFADVSNLYYCIDKRFEGRKLDYRRLMEKVTGFGKLQRAFAYGAQLNQEAEAFIALLRRFGYATKYKRPKMDDEGKVIRKADWNVGISMDVVRMARLVDLVVICSSDPDLVPLVEWVKEQGIRCVVLACGVTRELRDAADEFYEIKESLLEDVKEVA